MGRRGAIVRCSLALPLTLLLPVCTFAAQPAPLACPAGSTPRSVPIDEGKARVENCRDSKTDQRVGRMRVVRNNGFIEAEGQYRNGKLDGRYIVHAEDGSVHSVIQYVDGKKVDEKLTRRAIDKIFAEQNAIAQEKGKRWRIKMLDDYTAQYTIRVEAPFSWFPMNEDEMHGKLVSEPAMCAMFDLPADIRGLVARYEKSDGEELTTVNITPADCDAAARKRTSAGKR